MEPQTKSSIGNEIILSIETIESIMKLHKNCNLEVMTQLPRYIKKGYTYISKIALLEVYIGI